MQHCFYVEVYCCPEQCCLCPSSLQQLIAETPQDRCCQVDPVKQQVSLLKYPPNIPHFCHLCFGFIFYCTAQLLVWVSQQI